MEAYLTLIIGAFIGLLGYFASTFWIQPIIMYREVKGRIAGRLIYFANAFEGESYESLKKKAKSKPDDQDIQDAVEEQKERIKEKRLECRKLSGELEAVCMFLPAWYKQFSLKLRGEKPGKAKEEFIGLSNVRTYEDTQMRIYNIKKLLKLPGWKELKPPGTW